METQYQQVLNLITGQINPNVINMISPSFLSIPNSPDNTDWQQYQVWLLDGNQPLPPAGAK
jgi:hypothetical protein